MENHQSPVISPFDRIDIVPYKEEWPHEYLMIIQVLRSAFPKSVIFHHIGPTTVIGLAAKDIIDIQATVTSLGEIGTDYLSRHGFHERTGLSDHAPAGQEVHPDELTKRFFRGTIRPANLHVRLKGNFNGVTHCFAGIICAPIQSPRHPISSSRSASHRGFPMTPTATTI